MKSAFAIRFAVAVVLAVIPTYGLCGTGTVTIDVDKPSHAISPTLYGVCFQEINNAGDGGLYAELVRNRSFEDSESTDPWKLTTTGSRVAVMELDNSNPMTIGSEWNQHSLKITVLDPAAGTVRLTNEGYWGMSFKKGKKCSFSLYARCSALVTRSVTVTLESSSGKVYAKSTLSGINGTWKKLKTTLTPNTTDPTGRVVITYSSVDPLWLDMVSLFSETWKARSNGIRPDLAAMIDNLDPAFMRFSGGCEVERDVMQGPPKWKKTIGDVSERKGQSNVWGYRSTNGLGYHEYLQMCEDLKTEPVFIANCGIAPGNVVPLDEMGDLVQDALDAIEYANGSYTAGWGLVRSKAGHTKSFNLKYVQIGNGKSDSSDYSARYKLFYDAIKAKYPTINIIASMPITESPTPIIDEHYYSDCSFFLNNVNKYDNYDRSGPKICVGEYSVVAGNGKGGLKGALAEAAFMTGLERNSDVVVMASYAPLFVNVNNRGWNLDLINFDGSRAYGTPSYYVQQMFSRNKGHVVLPLRFTTDSDADPASFAATASRDKNTGEVIVKAVNASSEAQTMTISLKGVTRVISTGKVTVLSNADETAENSLTSPTSVSPVSKTFYVTGTSFTYVFAGNSVTVMRVKPY